MTQTELIKELTGCKELSEKFLSEYESVPEEKLNGLTRQQATSYEFGKTVGYGHAIELLKNNEIEPEAIRDGGSRMSSDTLIEIMIGHIIGIIIGVVIVIIGYIIWSHWID